MDRSAIPTHHQRMIPYEIRENAVWLKREPEPDEELPRVEVVVQPPWRVGGGKILPVLAPDGRLLTYGGTTE